ncbi:MAG: caspase family protein [Rhodopseudomonas palustris]|uniref:Caspase family protein n=1 Tax=Rhodopseudomonas palustris TaxID=1076 RepID=A0A933RTP4_RHOPL|nr:caspase family protein [Rhodopseudomonas palustris]
MTLVGWADHAVAASRVALVIGNSAYKNVAPLDNPARDAGAIAKMLRDAGFDRVDAHENLTITETRRVLRRFSDVVQHADEAVVYYAGHGVEIDGTNYLVPVDAALERDLDVFDEAFSLDRVLTMIEPAKRLHLVILDACRDNPFAKTMKRTLASRSIGRGLAKVEPTTANTLIAYAAKAGSTASDGDSEHSPFTLAVLKHLPRPGLDLRRAFGYVRDDVLKATQNKQEPYVYGSLGGDDLPLVPLKIVAVPEPRPQLDIRRDYELAVQLNTKEGYQAFLSQYPDGYYALLARGHVNKLDQAGPPSAPRPEPAQSPVQAAAPSLPAPDRPATPQPPPPAVEKAAAPAEPIPPPVAAAAPKPAQPAAQDKPDKPEKIAALAPAPESASRGGADAAAGPELTKKIETELKRLGCFAGDPDGTWTGATRKAVETFNKRTGAHLAADAATAATLAGVEGERLQVCVQAKAASSRPSSPTPRRAPAPRRNCFVVSGQSYCE